MRVTLHALGVALLPLIAGLAAWDHARSDSITFDEPAHLAAGVSFHQAGDFRLLYATPPLAQLWASIPISKSTEEADTPARGAAWERGDVIGAGRAWLDRPERIARVLPAARGMMIVLLIATLLAIYGVAVWVLGPVGGIAALALAAANPGLLAHGALVTTDVPITLAYLLVLASVGAFCRRPSLFAVARCGVAIGIAALTKYSWPLVLPAVAAMIVGAIVQARHGGAGAQPVARPRQSGAAIVGSAALLILIPWMCIWTAFGWRYSAMPNDAAAHTPMMSRGDPAKPPANLEECWRRLLDPPGAGTTATLVRAAREMRLLPEAYLYGLLYTARSAAEPRFAYLAGMHSDSGFLAYFPAILALKLPLATLALVAAGSVLVLFRLKLLRDPLLFAGLAFFGCVYFTVAVISGFDLGERHLIAIYPVLFVLGGAAVALSRGGVRLAAIALLALNGVTTALAHPHYLSYFNELAGGRAGGQRWLLDSNLDWGQDLARLADWQRVHADESLNVLYFGGVAPRAYDVDCRWLEDSHGFGDSKVATPGTYVISATELFGVYNRGVRDAFWTNMNVRMTYADLHERCARGGGGMTPRDEADFQTFRRLKLINALSHRPADERIGDSLFAFRVSPALLAELTEP